jgi:hypothetical protein
MYDDSDDDSDDDDDANDDDSELVTLLTFEVVPLTYCDKKLELVPVVDITVIALTALSSNDSCAVKLPRTY